MKEDEENRETEKARIQTQLDHALDNQDLVDRIRERQQKHEQVDPVVDGSVVRWWREKGVEHGKHEVVSSTHYLVLLQTDAFSYHRTHCWPTYRM